MDRTSQIIDRIYAAALDASAWPAVTDSLRPLYGCLSVGLYAADMERGEVSIFGMQGIETGYIQSYVKHHLLNNPWTLPALQRTGLVRTDRTLDEHYGRGYYRGTALFNEWMKPQDFIYTLGTNLLAERQTVIKFFMYRPERAGPFSGRDVSDFSRLSGHLGNALAVARRLDMQEAQLGAMLHLVDRLQLGVMFLDGRGRLMQANRSARQLFEEEGGLRLRDGLLSAARVADAKRLAATIRTALDVHHGTATDVPRRVGVSRPGKRPLCVIAVPLPRRGAEGPWFERRLAAALIVSDPEAEPVVPREWLRQRYGLTPRESCLAQSLSRGLALREAAETNGLTYETARWYLKNIFQKTGTGRQSDLVRLLLTEQVPMVPPGQAGLVLVPPMTA